MLLGMGRLSLVVVTLLAAVRAGAAFWHTDFGQAQAKAYAENRTMLVYFTCSDADAACARLKEEVFSKYEFQKFADQHLILVEVDFPRWKPVHPTHWKINKGLREKYMAYGYPELVILNNRGEALGKMGYRPGGVETYVKEIERMAGLTEKPGAAAPSEPPPMFNGAPTSSAPKYNELTLKSISATGGKRLALINNQTLAAGESGKVRLRNGEVKVRCEEIRDASVIVTVDGQPGRRELRLAR